VINEGVAIKDCSGQYCRQLPIPVFPTAFYETVVCLFLTALLFLYRSRSHIAGTVFAIYLVLNGLERFFIEKIRVNTQYELFGFHPTQAELIAAFLILTGIGLFVWCRQRAKSA
jgi:prolipoprotein diacylglyceryltransferase